MGIQIGSSLKHWNYFLALEKDLENLSRYVEFCDSNFDCYSLEMARILFSAASEADVVAKLLCKKLNSKTKADNIYGYIKEIKPACPKLPDFHIVIPRYSIDLHPWDNWKRNTVPLWWTAYNNVKHHRDTEFQGANLKNVLNAVAGLFVVILHLYKEKAENAELLPMSSFLRAGEKHFDGTTHNGIEVGINYKF